MSSTVLWYVIVLTPPAGIDFVHQKPTRWIVKYRIGKALYNVFFLLELLVSYNKTCETIKYVYIYIYISILFPNKKQKQRNFNKKSEFLLELLCQLFHQLFPIKNGSFVSTKSCGWHLHDITTNDWHLQKRPQGLFVMPPSRPGFLLGGAMVESEFVKTKTIHQPPNFCWASNLFFFFGGGGVS